MRSNRWPLAATIFLAALVLPGILFASAKAKQDGVILRRGRFPAKGLRRREAQDQGGASLLPALATIAGSESVDVP